MEETSNYKDCNKQKEDSKIDELEESFYIEQEYLKTMFDESKKSLNAMHKTNKMLDLQKAEAYKKIKVMYSKAMNEQLREVDLIFSVEKENNQKIIQSLENTQKSLNTVPDVDMIYWNIINEENIEAVKTLPIRLLIDGNSNYMERQTSLIAESRISCSDQLVKIYRNPKYPIFSLNGSNSEHRSSTPVSEVDSSGSFPCSSVKLQVDEQNDTDTSNVTQHHICKSFRRLELNNSSSDLFDVNIIGYCIQNDEKFYVQRQVDASKVKDIEHRLSCVSEQFLERFLHHPHRGDRCVIKIVNPVDAPWPWENIPSKPSLISNYRADSPSEIGAKYSTTVESYKGFGRGQWRNLGSNYVCTKCSSIERLNNDKNTLPPLRKPNQNLVTRFLRGEFIENHNSNLKILLIDRGKTLIVPQNCVYEYPNCFENQNAPEFDDFAYSICSKLARVKIRPGIIIDKEHTFLLEQVATETQYSTYQSHNHVFELEPKYITGLHDSMQKFCLANNQKLELEIVKITDKKDYEVDLHIHQPQMFNYLPKILLSDLLVFHGYATYEDEDILDSANSCSSISSLKYSGKYQYYEIDEKEICSGSYYSTYVGNYGDPGYFFIMPECSKEHSKQLELMLDEMDSFYADVGSGYCKNLKVQDYLLKIPSLGQPCAVKDDSGSYVRGKITGINPASCGNEKSDIASEGQNPQEFLNERRCLRIQKPTVNVFQVDDADINECSIDKIRLIPEKYLSIHMMAIPAKLSGIKPLSKNGKWSAECISFFETFFGTKATVYVDKRVTVPVGQRIKQYGLPSMKNISSVTLYKEENVEGRKKLISINAKLVEMGLAQLEDSDTQLSQMNYWNSFSEHVSQNDEIGLADTIHYTDYICDILSAYEPNYWYVRMSEQQNGADVNKIEINTLLEHMNIYYKEKNSSNFKNLETIYEVENEDADDFGLVYLHSNFRVGDLVVLNHEADGIWKRGKILEIHDFQSKANVLLVDEGMIAFNVLVEKISLLDESFKVHNSDIYCVMLDEINDVDMRGSPLHSNPLESLMEKEKLFNLQVYLRFNTDKSYERHTMVDVLQSPSLQPYPVKMIIKGNKGSADPFKPQTAFQKDLAKYLISKSLATDTSSWKMPKKG